METALTIIQILSAATLIVVILIQTKGTGFGRSFKSSASFTRRGLEKVVFKMTFVIAFVFILVSLLQLAI